MRSYNPPTATYRLQFHAGFTFRQLKEIIDYLHDLGITTIYASPIFKATPGSQHGYDVTDPHVINPEIGTIEELREIRQQLKKYNMTWLQDIVPNHMAFHAENTRLYDVMERGPLSPYYYYFDIDWHHPSFGGKLMAPFLGQPLDAALQEIKLSVDKDGFRVNYYQQVFPLSVTVYEMLAELLKDSDALPLIQLFAALYQRATAGTTLDDWQEQRRQLMEGVQSFMPALQALVEMVNKDKGLLTKLLEKQYYQLCHWKDADQAINYRRFFTVNELITLRMETMDVFNEYHTFLQTLYREDLVQGLRIDHIDGLLDPGAYISQLRQQFGSKCYIIAEKILEGKESLPHDWSLQGTSGYEFLSYTNHLLCDQQGVQKLHQFYQQLLPEIGLYEDIVVQKKRLILERYMGGEWENLVRLCYTLKLADARVNREQLKEAIGLFMVCLPVYRLYPISWPLDEQSQELIGTTFAKMRSLNREAEPAIVLLENWWEEGKASFLQRLMQFTGPLTAKGVEDTTFYVYNALLSHNEVGDSPVMKLGNFHQKMALRQQQIPHAINTTSTHDTKRGEDGRIRLNMLSLFTEEWQGLVQQWREENQSGLALNDEYFIYQAIIAGYPPEGITDKFIERLQAYFVKAVREAKVNSSWSAPDEGYEKKGTDFIERVLKHPSFIPFIEKIDKLAYRFSLAQVLIKLTAPGIPDTYQGTELWDLSYVDPDNRRPVDYEMRKVLLKEMKGLSGNALFQWLAAHRGQGAEKLYLIWKTLNWRRAHSDLFLEGDYIGLQGNGAHILGYARVYKQEWALTIVPLPGDQIGSLLLPNGAPGQWKNVFTGEVYHFSGEIQVQEVLRKFPVGLLVPAIL